MLAVAFVVLVAFASCADVGRAEPSSASTVTRRASVRPRGRRRVAAVAIATRLSFSRGRAQNTARPPPTRRRVCGSPPSSAAKQKPGTASVCSNVTKPNRLHEALGLLGSHSARIETFVGGLQKYAWRVGAREPSTSLFDVLFARRASLSPRARVWHFEDRGRNPPPRDTTMVSGIFAALFSFAPKTSVETFFDFKDRARREPRAARFRAAQRQGGVGVERRVVLRRDPVSLRRVRAAEEAVRRPFGDHGVPVQPVRGAGAQEQRGYPRVY